MSSNPFGENTIIMIKLYDIIDWSGYKPIPLFITEDGDYVLEGDLVYITVHLENRGRYIRPQLHALASRLNEDDTGMKMTHNGSHLPKANRSYGTRND